VSHSALSTTKSHADHLDQRQKPTSQKSRRPNKSTKSFELIWLEDSLRSPSDYDGGRVCPKIPQAAAEMMK